MATDDQLRRRTSSHITFKNKKDLFKYILHTCRKELVFYILFTLILCVVLALVTTIYWYFLVDKRRPTFYLNDNILLSNGNGVGLHYVPHVFSDLNLIHFRPSVKFDQNVGWNNYVEALKNYVRIYDENENHFREKTDCRNQPQSDDYHRMSLFEQGKSCIFTQLDFGEHNVCVKERDFEYEHGMPCILIRLNKIYAWIPEAYENRNDVPLEIRHLWNETMRKFVLIHCSGETPWDEDFIHEIKYFSILNNEKIGGLPFYYFPYLNQPGYVPPAVFVYIKSVEINVLIHIKCRAYAKNILPSSNYDEIGAVHFELIID